MKLMFILCFILTKGLSAESPLLPHDIHERYTMAPFDKNVCLETLDILSNIPDNNLALAYLGAFQIIRAKHFFNPFKKLKTFSEGKNNLEEAVRRAPDIVEIRFIRMSVQQEIPGILQYKSDIAADKEFILSHFHRISDPELRHFIIGYMENAALLTPEEKNTMVP